MKKNTMMRIASVLLIAVLMTTCVISGTFAKYTSSATGTAFANIAKWSFEVNDKDIATETQFTFDLLTTTTFKDSDGTSEEDDVNGELLAPGTTGSFSIILENTSDVTAAYTINLAYDNDATNTLLANILEFKTASSEWITLSELNNPENKYLSNEIAATGSETIAISWRWAFQQSGTEDKIADANTTDTNIGKTADATWTLNATITAEQVD